MYNLLETWGSCVAVVSLAVKGFSSFWITQQGSYRRFLGVLLPAWVVW